MPMASTNSGKAMLVSAIRPTTRSVQPPKNPAATPRDVATQRVDAAPPCGEGLGVGLEFGCDASGDNNDPPPQPSSTRGKGADRVCCAVVLNSPRDALLMPRSSRADRSGRRA